MEGAFGLASALAKVKCPLKHLNVSSNMIYSRGAVVLIANCIVNEKLESLKIGAAHPRSVPVASLLSQLQPNGATMVLMDESNLAVHS